MSDCNGLSESPNMIVRLVYNFVSILIKILLPELGKSATVFPFVCTGGMDESMCVFPPEETEDLVFAEKKKLIQWIAYRIIGPAVVAIGLVGNILNLIVLTRPSLRGVTYTYLIGLACSDLGVLLCAIAMIMRQTDTGNGMSWSTGFFYSFLELPLANTFMASSIFIVICLTIERFVSVCLPTKFTTFHTRKNCHRAIVGCYIVAILVSCPLCMLKRLCLTGPELNNTVLVDDNLRYRFTENFAITSQPAWRSYLIISEIIVRFGPALILAVVNLVIILRFRKITETRIKMRQGNVNSARVYFKGTPATKKSFKEEKRLFTLLSSIVLLFFVTTTPVAFMSIYYSETLDKNLYFQIFRAVANSLELCNFALNFYIYFLCSKEFRKNFLKFFTPIFKKTKLNFRIVAHEAHISLAPMPQPPIID